MIRDVDVLTTRVVPIGVEEAAGMIADWADGRPGRVVCAVNVHMVMEAWDAPGFAAALAGADLAVCDGRPLVWACRLKGVKDARHARGHDLLHEVCARAAKHHLTVGLYGGEPRVSAAVRRRLEGLYPGLDVGYCWSPPFRELSAEEDDAVVAAITGAAVRVLFVGLGCPKQERWMLAHRERLGCVALGVGAAFDMVAGDLREAPRWMQVIGLEWVFRLANEPSRLWRRYAKHNGRFVYLVLRQWLRDRRDLAASSFRG
jgi:N-acetylglucosaminyldiphosphoundecaprenol N-acetyl-beta-D-mannosaminyltransferase